MNIAGFGNLVACYRQPRKSTPCYAGTPLYSYSFCLGVMHEDLALQHRQVLMEERKRHKQGPTICLYQYCKSRMTYYSDCGWAPFGWTQEVAKGVGKCGVDMTLTDGKCAYSCPLVSSFCSDQTDWDDDTGKCVSTCDPKAPSPSPSPAPS